MTIFKKNTPGKKPAPKKSSAKKPFSWKRFFGWTVGLGAAGAVSAGCIGLIAYSVIYQQLPPIDSLTDYKPKVPLRVYSADGTLIGEFGEERRDFVRLNEIPGFVKYAILAAEDNGFYQHSGIEFSGIARAAISNLISGRRGQGGSTITMQVARNFFLSTERTYTRKIFEIAMAYKIENHLTKDEILEVYLNQIYLGQRAYGFAAAAQTYFGKTLNELTIGEAATIAGLPVAPSAYNPIVNPARATARKNYVLGRMHQLGYIDTQTYETELNAPLLPVQQGSQTAEKNTEDLHAEYAAEMARMLVYNIFREETYTRGLNVYTTIRDRDQRAAWESVRSRLIAYDRKYRYRGPSGFVDISDPASRDNAIRVALRKAPSSPNLEPAVVSEITSKTFKAVILQGKNLVEIDLNTESRKFAGKYLTSKAADKRLKPGSIIRVSHQGKKAGWTLSQIPEVQAGFVSAEFDTGAVRALVGGFDFYLNMFNHATQALRQPGSSFKPFIYSAALDKGFNAGTIINDAPLFIDPRLTGGELWEPRNYDNRFDGPMTLARGLQKSKNLVSIRIMQAIGGRYAQEYVSKFGFPPSRTPAQLTTALGAGSTTPWEMAQAFSVFANGGYLVKPYLIDNVTDSDGRVLMRANNPKAGDERIRAIDERNAYIMHTLLNSVATVPGATAARAYRELKRSDIGGKTGTTNNAHDAWFAGYAGKLTAVGWMGYDQMRPLGSSETGGGLMLPIWLDYMKRVLKDEPIYRRRQPSSVALVNGVYYYADSIDQSVKDVPLNGRIEDKNRAQDILRDQIF